MRQLNNILAPVILLLAISNYAIADRCFENPCQNGGTFVPDPFASYHCDCTPGFHGLFCEEDGDASSEPIPDCPLGWYRHDNSCYKYFSDRRTYAAARATCEAEQANVLIMETTEKEDWLLENYIPTNVRIWLGAEYPSDTWLWTSTQEPVCQCLSQAYRGLDSVDRGPCLSYLTLSGYVKSGYLENYSCTQELAFACQIDLPETPRGRDCRYGWYKYGDSCYKFINSIVPFDIASQACQSLGAHLWTVETTTEEQYMKTFVLQEVTSAGSNFRIWLGGRYINGDFRWITTQEPVCHCLQWGTRGPESTSGGLCLAAYSHDNAPSYVLGDIHEMNCEYPANYICEYELV